MSLWNRVYPMAHITRVNRPKGLLLSERARILGIKCGRLEESKKNERKKKEGGGAGS